MITPATLHLTANRHAPFVYMIEVPDYDLGAATLAMQIRLVPDAPGSPLVDLAIAAAGSQGLSVVVAAGDSTITIQIDEATLEALPAAGETGDDLDLWYDMAVTPSGGVKSIWFRGLFTVRAGVTQ